jgi:hypothetical protein
MITFEKFCNEIAHALDGHVSFDSHGEPSIYKDGVQVVWLTNDPGCMLADISDIFVDGHAYTRCYIDYDEDDGNFYVWDNDTTGPGQIFIYCGKRIKTAIKKALSYNPFTDYDKYPAW